MSILRYFITSKAKRNLLKFFFASEGAYYTREIARLTGEPLNAVRRELSYLEKGGLLHSYMQGNQKYYEVVKSFPLLHELERFITELDDSPTPPASSKIKQPENHRDLTSRKPMIEKDNEPIIPGINVVMNHELEDASEEVSEVPTYDLAQTEATSVEHNIAEEPSAYTVSSFNDYLKEQFIDISGIALAVIHGEAAKSVEIPETGIDLLIVGDINADTILEHIARIEDETGVRINLTRMTRSDFDYRNAKGDPLIRRIWGEKKLVVKGRQSER
jgi:hypothetical protein